VRSLIIARLKFRGTLFNLFNPVRGGGRGSNESFYDAALRSMYSTSPVPPHILGQLAAVKSNIVVTHRRLGWCLNFSVWFIKKSIIQKEYDKVMK